MRFVTAVALAEVMLWEPVDGVAQEISLYDSEGEAVAYLDLSPSCSVQCRVRRDLRFGLIER